LSEAGIDIAIKFFSSSGDLFNYLSASEMPSLILVDYNATPENGFEVLKKLKRDPSFSGIPVVILSENDFAEYRNKCYAEGASSFIKKPGTIKLTRSKIKTFFTYWFEVAEV
jgi:CheY-like chemotaxis protein